MGGSRTTDRLTAGLPIWSESQSVSISAPYYTLLAAEERVFPPCLPSLMPCVSCVSENAFLVSDEEQNICCMAALEQTVYRDVSFAFRRGPRTQKKSIFIYSNFIYLYQ